FIAYFNWSNLGTWLAVNGAEFLESVEFTGIGLIIGYVIFTALLNFLITSGSAKWAIEAPIFVPMFMQLGYDSAFTQSAYRIADSSFNIVSQLLPYMVFIFALLPLFYMNANIDFIMFLLFLYFRVLWFTSYLFC